MSYLRFRAVTKDFPGVRALDGVSFDVEKGTVLGLCGENGAGKSTLMNVLAGIHPYGTYEGAVEIAGKPIRFRDPKEAEEAGVAIIHQELSLFPEMTVAENILIGRENARNGVLDPVEVFAAASELLERYGVALDPAARVGDLKLGEWQLVEITRALGRNADILVLDEPTSALSARETSTLFKIIRGLKQAGVTMVYISHKIDELFEICDRIAVLRDGRCVQEPTPCDALTREGLLRSMVGRSIEHFIPYTETSRGAPRLEVREWQVRRPLLPGEFLVADVSFSVHSGEVFGIYGLMGSGRTEIVTSLFAGFPPNTWDGFLRVNGRTVRFRDTRDAIEAGLMLTTEERRRFGLIPTLGVGDNITLASLDRCSDSGVLDEKRESEIEQFWIHRLRIKTPGPEEPVLHLSGGNQQKVIVARCLAAEPRILLLDEPTRGVDVGARQEIYTLINELKERGMAILLVTSDLPELLGLCDRMLVMHEGWAVGLFERGEADAETIGALATGNV